MNMVPINNYTATNQTSQLTDDASLKEKYGITKEYEKDYPEDSALVLSLVRSNEEALRAAGELVQSSKELSNGMTRLIEKSEKLDLKLDSIIESEKRTTQALRNLAKTSSEIHAITSNLANMVSICANRIFNPVRSGWNHFCLLTGHREPAAVLPREGQLAIENNPENVTSITDPANREPGDEKKNFASLLMFFAVSGGLYFLHTGERRS